MDEDTVRKRLVEQDADPIPELTQIARLIGYRGGGIFHSYNIRVEGDSVPFIAKFPSHEQPPGHRLLAELVVARLAHLFSPPLAAKHAVLEIRPEHVTGLICQGCMKPIEHGFAFGSRELPGVVEFRGGFAPPINVEDAARVVGFQTWLEGADTQMLICADDQTGYSMDHAAYLSGGHTWNFSNSPDLNVSAVCIAGLEANGRLSDVHVFDDFLNQLDSFMDQQIVDVFARLPNSWWSASDLERVMNFQHLPTSCGLIAESSGFQVFDNRYIERKRVPTPRNRAN